MFGVMDDVVAVDVGETASLLRPVAQVYLASPFTGLDAAALTEAQCVRCVLKQEFLAYADVRFNVYDPHDNERPLNTDVLAALEHYDVQVVPWIKRQEYAAKLAA